MAMAEAMWDRPKALIESCLVLCRGLAEMALSRIGMGPYSGGVFSYSVANVRAKP